LGTLLRQSLTLTRLREAFARVSDNRGQAGVDGVEIETFAQQLKPQLDSLRADVSGNRYQPAPLKRLWLPRPGKEPRPIGIPTVRDRVLQTAVALTITPLLEAEFEECSYAYRRGRSVRMAVERIGVLQRQGYGWVVEADIERFFDCIPHPRLLAELQAVVHDSELVALTGQWLAAPVQQGAQLIPVGIGIPQGAPISPLLANLYLDQLDEELLDQGYALVRYADDFIVLAKSRDRAEAAVELSDAVLRDLELRLNPLKTRVVNFDTGFKFLGWNFVRSLAVPVRRAGADAARTVNLLSHAHSLAEGEIATIPSPSSGSVVGGEVGRELPEPSVFNSPETGMAAAFAEALADQPGWQTGQGDEAEFSQPPREQENASLIPPDENDAVPVEENPDDEPPPAAPPDNLQRTLYLIDPAASLSTENRHLIVRKDDAVILDLPAVNVDQVMLFGRNAASTAALVCCMQHGIPVAYLSRMGKFYGRLEPPSGEAVNLLSAQFAAQAAGTLNLALAREFVRGKLANSALLLSRYSRHRRTEQDRRILEAINLLRDLARRTRGAADLDTLRGIEGAGAAAYFGAWRVWLAPEWKFGARVQQAGGDPINALLDFGYTLLYQSMAGLIQARGLNPWIGHLHAQSAGHLALASDLMEEFRALVVDTVVLNACLNRRFTPADFVARNGGCVLRTEAARAFVREIETRLNTERQHPRSEDLLDLRRIADAQVRSLCGCYRQGSAQPYTACVFR